MVCGVCVCVWSVWSVCGVWGYSVSLVHWEMYMYTLCHQYNYSNGPEYNDIGSALYIRTYMCVCVVCVWCV